jgi:ATP-dependent Zn protease
MAVALLGGEAIAEANITHFGGHVRLADEASPITADALDRQVLIALGGLTAEEIVLGGASEGAAHDLSHATSALLRQTEFGQLPGFPAVSVSTLDEEMSEELQGTLCRAIVARLATAREDVRLTLHGQATKLSLFADRLAAAETLLGHELRAALHEADFNNGLPDYEGPAFRWPVRI